MDTLRTVLRLLVCAATLVGSGRVAGGLPVPTPADCVGDCTGTGTVTVDKILTLVNIALGEAAVASCSAGDANADGYITVDEILSAVNNALNGCPPLPPPPAGISVLASSVAFIPQTMESHGTVDVRSRLAVRGSLLLFNDGSEAAPVKRLSLRNGTVTPVVLRMGVPAAVVIHGTDVFWLETRNGIAPSGCVGNGVIGVVRKASLAGTSTTLLAKADNCRESAVDLVADDATVYWVTSVVSPDRYTIEAVPTAGGVPTPLVTTSSPIVALAADASHIYWAEDRFPDPDGQGSAIKSMPKAGGAVAELATGLRALKGGLALRGADVVFADTDYANQDRLMAVPVLGGPVRILTEIPDQGSTKIPRRIATDDANVYWIDADSLNAMPLMGGRVTPLVTGVDSPGDLTIKADRLVWTESPCCAHAQLGAIKMIPNEGGPVTVVADGVDAPGRLATDLANVFWTEGGPIGLIEGFGRIAKIPINGGRISTVVGGVSDSLPPIAVDDRNVYVADKFRIKRAPIEGSRAVDTLAAGDFYIADVVTDGANVYWIEDPSSTVRKVPVSGGAVVTLASGSGPAGHMALDAASVYWIDHFDMIKKVSIAGGPVSTLAAGLPFLSDLVVDGANVYFSEQDTGNIRSVPINGGPIASVGAGLPLSWNILAVDGLNVYDIDQVRVGAFPKLGGPGQVVGAELQSVAELANAIAVDGTSIYWTEVGGGTITRYSPE